VKAGDVLVRLRAADADAAIEQARTQIQEARARLEQSDSVTLPVAEQSVRQAQSNLRVAEAEFQRAQTLVEQQFFSPSKLDEAQRQLDNARSQLRTAQAQRDASMPRGAERQGAAARLAQAEAALASAQARRDLLTLRAPVDALVVARDAEPGDVAQAGRALLTLAQSGETRIYATLDEKNLRYLQLDARALAVADAFPGPAFRVGRLLHRTGHRRAARHGRGAAARARAAGLPQARHDGVGRSGDRPQRRGTRPAARSGARRRNPRAVGAAGA
jgi:HlyD family secretion protein